MICHKGFLHKAGFIGQQCFHGDIVVVRVWSGDIDQIDILVGYQFRVGTIGLRYIPLCGKSIRLFL